MPSYAIDTTDKKPSEQKTRRPTAWVAKKTHSKVNAIGKRKEKKVEGVK